MVGNPSRDPVTRATADHANPHRQASPAPKALLLRKPRKGARHRLLPQPGGRIEQAAARGGATLAPSPDLKAIWPASALITAGGKKQVRTPGLAVYSQALSDTGIAWRAVATERTRPAAKLERSALHPSPRNPPPGTSPRCREHAGGSHACRGARLRQAPQSLERASGKRSSPFPARDRNTEVCTCRVRD